MVYSILNHIMQVFVMLNYMFNNRGMENGRSTGQLYTPCTDLHTDMPGYHVHLFKAKAHTLFLISRI